MANKRRKGMREVKSVPHSKRVGMHSVKVSHRRTQKIKKIENTEKMKLYGMKAIERKNALYGLVELLSVLGISDDSLWEVRSFYMIWEEKRADRVRNSG